MRSDLLRCRRDGEATGERCRWVFFINLLIERDILEQGLGRIGKLHLYFFDRDRLSFANRNADFATETLFIAYGDAPILSYLKYTNCADFHALLASCTFFSVHHYSECHLLISSQR